MGSAAGIFVDPPTKAQLQSGHVVGEGLKDLPPIHKGQPQTTPPQIVEQVLQACPLGYVHGNCQRLGCQRQVCQTGRLVIQVKVAFGSAYSVYANHVGLEWDIALRDLRTASPMVSPAHRAEYSCSANS